MASCDRLQTDTGPDRHGGPQSGVRLCELAEQGRQHSHVEGTIAKGRGPSRWPLSLDTRQRPTLVETQCKVLREKRDQHRCCRTRPASPPGDIRLRAFDRILGVAHMRGPFRHPRYRLRGIWHQGLLSQALWLLFPRSLSRFGERPQGWIGRRCRSPVRRASQRPGPNPDRRVRRRPRT